MKTPEISDGGNRMEQQTHADWLREFLSEFYAFPCESVAPAYAAEVESRLQTIADDIEAKDRRINALIQAGSRVNDEICQTLGKALGYPTIHTGTVDGQTAIVSSDYPGAVATDDACVGDHVAETLAAEAAQTIAALTAERDRLREVLAVAQHTIKGLVDQQAMPDDWYEEPLQMVVEALANGEVKE